MSGQGWLQVAGLASELGPASMTIRRDLARPRRGA
ncbi:MAG: DeoR family transcriptional regulator [Lentisphaerae bacterium]|nr:DeoR family transcriptional regulator [Lentisphaerota bacterium]